MKRLPHRVESAASGQTSFWRAICRYEYAWESVTRGNKRYMRDAKGHQCEERSISALPGVCQACRAAFFAERGRTANRARRAACAVLGSLLEDGVD